jgi:hypothetical protein
MHKNHLHYAIVSLKQMAGNTISIIAAECFLQHSEVGGAYHFTDAH